MGRQWLYWVGGGGGMGRPSSRRRRMPAEVREEEGAAAGCMCAVLQLFDLHQFQLPLNQQHSLNQHPFLQEEATASSKGAEAPRNSLELEESAAMSVASKPLTMKEEENLIFPLGIQIRTRPSISASKSRAEDFHSDCSVSSPGTKTPNLVARLMGLDLLPECNSPSVSACSNSKPQTKSHRLNPKKDRNILHIRSNRCFSDDDISLGARSLPETPRISSARRSDVENHRLSLQINKENANEEFLARMAGRRGRFKLQQQDESTSSPGQYAKHIVKQVKQSVSRRVGLVDITNTSRERDDSRRDQNLLLLKLNRKTPKSSPSEISPDGKQSTTPSCSPKLRFLDSKKIKTVTDMGIKSPRNSTSSSVDSFQWKGVSNPSKPKLQAIIQEHHQQQQQQQNDCKKVETGKSCLRQKKLSPQTCDEAIRSKKDEPFVRSTTTNKLNLIDKKSKKTPLSSEILHITGPTLLPVKKGPSATATKLPQKQAQISSDALSSKRNTQLSCNTRHSYNRQLPHKTFTIPENVLPDSSNGCATTFSAAPEYRCYVQKILKRAGIIDKFTSLTLGKWHTASHPLDPSIFYYLELFHPTAAVLSRRCNRKLIFQLVDELLAEFLRPHLDFKPWASPVVGNNAHYALDDDLFKKIESFPAADCQVLEDIDSLIDKDLCKSPLNGYFEEEGERLVSEIEGEIVEWLVKETVEMVGDSTDEGRDRSGGRHVGSSRDEMP